MRRGCRKIKGMPRKKRLDSRELNDNLTTYLFLIGGLQYVREQEAIQRKKDSEANAFKYQEKDKKIVENKNLKLKQGGN